MARQPKRSAFVLTRIFNSLFKNYLTLLLLLITSVKSENSNISEDHYNNFNNNSVNTNNQPKFGDRILPRHRQITSTISNTHSSNNVNRLLDNFSNSNNNSDHNLILSVTDDHLIYNRNDHSDGDLIQLNNKNNSDHDINNNNNNNNKQNNHMPSIVTNAVIPVIEQQHQRLDQLELRRNDYNIETDSIDLVDHFNISKADRLIEMSTEFFIVPQSATPTSQPAGLNQRGGGHQQQPQARSSTPRPVLILASRTPPSNLSVTPPTIIGGSLHGGLRKEPWVVPILVLASLAMIMMTAFEIFVLFKAWRTSPSRRHLFLGQMLLLGLFACAALGAVLTASPTIISCAAIRFGAGVAYALVFAALLVKCVFLISLNGGVYLPAPYQGLLLLFAVLIQVAIGTQWLMTQPPDIQIVVSTVPHVNVNKFSMLITSTDITRHNTIAISLCKTQFSELLLSMIYIIFLIIFVAILAIKSRGIRDNYREATYIGLAIGGAIPIWLGWTLCGLAVADRHKDACLAFGLVATSSTIFLVMFMPKGRQLAAMGKEGLYVEDREEQFSSLSRAGSGYSPSFFHFKPIKYGVMGGIPNSTTNTGNGNISSKHQSAATLGGDRVALVAAAPPSYTRMYHYFPAHMTHPFCFYPQPPPPPTLSPPPPPLKTIGGQPPTSAQIAQTIRYPGLFMRPDEANLYTTLEPTLSSNPNVYFQRSGGVHPGMMY